MLPCRDEGPALARPAAAGARRRSRSSSSTTARATTPPRWRAASAPGWSPSPARATAPPCTPGCWPRPRELRRGHGRRRLLRPRRPARRCSTTSRSGRADLAVGRRRPVAPRRVALARPARQRAGRGLAAPPDRAGRSTTSRRCGSAGARRCSTSACGPPLRLPRRAAAAGHRAPAGGSPSTTSPTTRAPRAPGRRCPARCAGTVRTARDFWRVLPMTARSARAWWSPRRRSPGRCKTRLGADRRARTSPPRSPPPRCSTPWPPCADGVRRRSAATSPSTATSPTRSRGARAARGAPRAGPSSASAGTASADAAGRRPRRTPGRGPVVQVGHGHPAGHARHLLRRVADRLDDARRRARPGAGRRLVGARRCATRPAPRPLRGVPMSTADHRRRHPRRRSSAAGLARRRRRRRCATSTRVEDADAVAPAVARTAASPRPGRRRGAPAMSDDVDGRERCRSPSVFARALRGEPCDVVGLGPASRAPLPVGRLDRPRRRRRPRRCSAHCRGRDPRHRLRPRPAERAAGRARATSCSASTSSPEAVRADPRSAVRPPCAATSSTRCPARGAGSTALLADGNIGIGGRPASRCCGGCATLLAPRAAGSSSTWRRRGTGLRPAWVPAARRGRHAAGRSAGRSSGADDDRRARRARPASCVAAERHEYAGRWCAVLEEAA